MISATLKDFLESGLYFGHPSKQFDPRMKPFIFGKRQGIYIIDLEKTKACLEAACEFLKESAGEGKKIIIVGTKRQARELVKSTAEGLGVLFMANRWLGGTLTNFQTMKKRIDRLNDLESKEAAGLFEKLTKKDASTARKEKERLMRNLEGVRKLDRIPDIMLVIDTRKEENAIREAKKMGMKVVGVVDTNSNPILLDYPIPANDDGIKGLRLLLAELGAAIQSGQEARALLNKEANKKKEEEAAKELAQKKIEEAKKKEKEIPPPEKIKPVPVQTVAAKETKPVLPEKAPVETVLAKEKKPETTEKSKTADKPKPRPRIRAKIRRTTTTKKVVTKTKKTK
ncbi:MAG: 30S ribosomal protein S2 [Candidatus Omnitrophica bacterium]|nr:30S ribosomal protein S2 [Candidatus Omnitrophota bacterium]